ncbi:hypothetical protein ABIC90_002390 [Variovorax boronicumulans]
MPVVARGSLPAGFAEAILGGSGLVPVPPSSVRQLGAWARFVQAASIVAASALVLNSAYNVFLR